MPDDTVVTRGTSYSWTYTPTDLDHYTIKTGSVILWSTPTISVSASAGNKQATVTWVVDAAGQVIDKYQVTCVETGDVVMLSPSVSSHTFTELTNGRTYSFKVKALYGDRSVESTAVSATPKAPSSSSGGTSGGNNSSGGSSSSGGGSGSGGSGSGGGSTPAASPTPSVAPSASAAPGNSPVSSAAPAPSAAPTVTTNPDGSTTTTTTNQDGSTTAVTTDTDGTKTTETVTTGENGNKITEIVVEKPDGTTEKTTEIVNADGSTIHEEQVIQPSGDFTRTAIETDVKTDKSGNVIGETTTIRTEEQTGKNTQTATFRVVDPEKHVIKLTQATTTVKNGVVTIPKTVKVDGTTYKVTTLAKGMLKGSETKPKKVTLQAGGIKTVQKGAFNNLAKKGTITIAGTKKQFENLKKMIVKSGLPKGVKVKRA